MNREELIEEAAKGMYAPRAWSEAGEAHRSRYRSMARSALAVFEQAHTPTDDEREAPASTSEVAAIIDRAMRPWGLSNIGTHTAARALVAAGFRRTVQGEPTDAQVTAAMVAYEGHPTRVEAWRAALRAAAATHEGENRG